MGLPERKVQKPLEWDMEVNDEIDKGFYAKVHVYNYTLEKINIVREKTSASGSERHYASIPIDEMRTISIQVNRSVSAIGDASGKHYGTRNFTLAVPYDWIIVK
jgi:hypothetical protein